MFEALYERAPSKLLEPFERFAYVTPVSFVLQRREGGNPLEWLANLNPFDRQRREAQEELRGERERRLSMCLCFSFNGQIQLVGTK